MKNRIFSSKNKTKHIAFFPSLLYSYYIGFRVKSNALK